jgi:heavy metal translocating P-type ATPase
MKKEKFNVTGMTCAACQANITRRVKKVSGVKDVNVSLLANQMSVTYDEASANETSIIDAVTAIGYGASPLNPPTGREDKSSFRTEWTGRQKITEDHQIHMKKRLWSSVIFLIPLLYLSMGPMAGLPLPSMMSGPSNLLILALTELFLTLPIAVINREFYQSGLKSLFRGAPNMDSLVALGSGAALVYGIFAMYRMSYGFGHNDMFLIREYGDALYFESCAMILTLVTVGKYLEARSTAKTSDALSRLIDLAPKTAAVIRNGKEETIPAEQVVTGDLVVIKPGNSIPVDGVITEGRGYVDQSPITGESIPVTKTPGDSVISATLNKNGTFRFRASRVGNDTTLAQIIRLVDEAGNSKAPIAKLADRISGIFVPAVIIIAFITAVVWLIAGQSFEFALSSAITVLVISCPCALGLATPVAIMSGTGKAAEFGVLIKSAESLENLHSIDTVVMDKTGTITSGHPSVTDILPADSAVSPEELLMTAASAESGSDHPLALAVIEEAKRKKIDFPYPESFQSIEGRGIRAETAGHSILAGNLAFMKENGMTADSGSPVRRYAEQWMSEGKTVMWFADRSRLIGIMAVSDTIREDSREAVRKFHEAGIQTVMLTGDNRNAAQAVGAAVGIDTVISEVLPAEKDAQIRSLQEKGHKVAMVGDGINDAPALTRADIGIAIGAGTDIAIDSADVVLMKNSLRDVASAVRLSRAVIRNIHVNLFWAFFYNILGIPVAAGVLYPAFGIRLSPMIAAAAMSLSSVCVVTNALRLRFFKNEEGPVHTAVLPQKTLQPDDSLISTDSSHKSANLKGAKEMKKIITVDGMMCAHCQSHVQQALAAVEGVEKAEVSLEKKEATVTLSKDVPQKELFEAVTEAGYTPTKCVVKG